MDAVNCNKEMGASPNTRILAVIETHPEAVRLLRAAKRKAKSMNAEWEVIFVESPPIMRSWDAQEQEQLLQLLTLAGQMGAIVTQVQSKSILQGVLDLVNERTRAGCDIPLILVGVVSVSRFVSFFHSPLARKLQRKLRGKCEVMALSLGQEMHHLNYLKNYFRVSIREIFISFLAVGLAALFIVLLNYFWPNSVITSEHRNKAIIFMTACAFVSARYGFLPGVTAAVASFLALSLLFIAPRFSLVMDNPNDVANLAIFTAGAILISFFGNREHTLREVLLKRADRLHSLLRVHRMTLNNQSPEEALEVLDAELSKLLNTEIAFFMPTVMNPDQLETLFHNNIELSEADKKALCVCWDEIKTTGVGAPYDPGCNWRFEPLITAQDEIGVLGIKVTRKVTLDAAFGRLLSGIADQAALILERLELGQLAEENRISMEREKLRSMLLSSVSHDLKTPLASVIGSLSVYRSMGEKLPEEHRLILINTALEEAQRLDSFITNILDMTRIESGQIELKQEWTDPEEMIKDVRKTLRERIRSREIALTIETPDIEVSMDGMMTGQVVQNLLDNAAKYTPEGTPIEILWRAGDDGFVLQIRDSGPGIPDDQLDKVFDKYARIRRQDRQVAGTGLGLAIARAVMQAQNGNISVKNHPDGGAVFTLSLPRWRKIAGSSGKSEKKVA